MKVQRKSLSQVQQEKKVLSSHTTTNPPSQTSNMGIFFLDFKLDAVDDNANANGAIEVNAYMADVTDKAHEAFEADKANKAYVAN
jgi:hypothetical protein